MVDEQTRTDTYLRTLLVLLIAATFFEGFDGAILALVLPGIRDTFNVTESALGVSRALIELGLGAAFFLARLGDRIGRRKLLLYSVIGYTVMTTLTAFSWDLWSFTAFQSLARVFLGAEYAVAVTMIVEEFPAKRRGRALGILLMCAAIGAVAVALLLLAGLASGPLEWRTLYLVGVIPLLFLAYFRRRIKETRRFEALRAEGGEVERVPFFEPWRAPYRRTLLLVGTVHLLRSLPLFGATAWFFYYAEREAGIGQTFLYVIFIVAYGFGTGGYAVCGGLMERWGRRPTAIVYGVVAGVSSFLLFQARTPGTVGLLLVVAVFFGLGQAPVLGAMSTELFPTYIRNQAAAWSRNVFEIAGFILGPLLVGVLGDHYTGALGSVGDAVSILTFLFIPGAWLIWRHLPEARGRELEDVSAEVAAYLPAETTPAPVPEVEGAPAPSSPGGRRTRLVRAAVVLASVIVVGGAVVGVAAVEGIARRPEGAAERFLQAIDRDDAEQLRSFGSVSVAERMPDAEVETIEVGGSRAALDVARVPFRLVVSGDREVRGTLLLERRGGPDGEWRVVGLGERLPTERVPSEGGPAPEGAPFQAWVIAALATVGLAVVLEGVLRVLGGPPVRRADRAGG